MKPAVPCVVCSLVAATLLGCGKDPSAGQSSAHESTVKDGQVVLVRSGKQVGAFRLRNQQLGGKNRREQTDYTWFFRSDGRGTFAKNDPAVSFGSRSNAQQISFGPFQVPWSIHSNGCGFVYYSRLPMAKGAAAYELCVTRQADVQGIDANDGHWNFRDRPSFDPLAHVERNHPEVPILRTDPAKRREAEARRRMMEVEGPWQSPPGGPAPAKREPAGPANGSPPIRSETNSTSSAAGPRY